MSTTIYHSHHIIPRHAGGTDHPDNIARLTVEEHSEAHRLLYEKYGRWQDKLAWQGLAGFKDKEQIIKEIQSRPKSEEHAKKIREMNIGRKHTPETKKKMSEASKGKPKSEQMRKRLSETKTGTTRPPFSEEWINNLSEAHKGEKNGFYGKTHSPETKKKISEARKRQTGVKRGPYRSKYVHGNNITSICSTNC